MEIKWLTTQEVAEKYPHLTERAQASLRHRRSLTYTVCAGKVIYNPEWIDAYLNKNTIKAIS